MELKNVSIYSPDNMPDGHRFLYFKSEDGKDFYESLNLFTKKYKLCIEPDTGIIHSMAKDVSSLYPAGFTVVEVDELPDGVDISGDWLFEGEKVVPRIPTQGERVAKAKFEKASLMQQASTVIAPLQDAVDLDMATEAEKAQLIAWKKYRVLLNRIDIRTLYTILCKCLFSEVTVQAVTELDNKAAHCHAPVPQRHCPFL